MAPKVCVPADFGRHHIGVPSHGNLAFNLTEVVQIKANSIIMSLNSPVIDDLTTNLHLMSLEAEDFTREAVDCFIEASYTGEVEMLNKGNFRDVNKMSHVFGVSWLTAKCKQFFVSYLDQLDSDSSYTDLLFVVEEAVYLLSAVKKREFLDLVVPQMCNISTAKRDSFIVEYLSDFAYASSYKIDACISFLGFDIHVLIEFLVDYLEKTGKKSLDDSSRYLIRKADMNLCFQNKQDVYTRLFTLLSDLTDATKEDLQLFVMLFEQNTSKRKEIATVEKCLAPVLTFSFSGYIISPDELSEEEGATSFLDVIDRLAARKDIKNLYSFIDGLWCRLDNVKCSRPIGALKKIIDIKNRNGWSKMCKNYVLGLRADEFDYTKPFFQMVTKCNQLVDDTNDTPCAVIFERSSTADFTRDLFLRNNNFKFKLPGLELVELEFVLLTSPLEENEPNSFQMQWGLYHCGIKSAIKTLPNLHFALQRLKDDTVWETLPITWCGQPTCDKTKTYWNWGYIKFHQQNMTEIELIGEGTVNWNFYTKTFRQKLRFVAFIVNKD